ncbi:MAG TPA: ECF-type sigma factor [Bryobacteraceae bacterium]|jgi:RNA polymerase sigma factor (sigma-70 family)|nr:ECF-type sigma factor [Bryobacteraceae bacterium]
MKQGIPFVLSDLRLLGQRAGLAREEGESVEQATHIAREILVERARSRTLMYTGAPGPDRDCMPDQLLNLDRALNALAEIEPRKSKAIELRHFAGLSAEQVAATLAVPVRTVQRDLRFAEAWLCRELSRHLNP